MRRVLRRARAWLGDTRGTNLIEAAILTPLLLLLTFAIVEFGSVFYVYLSLENGVSEATRYAVTGRSRAGQTREQSIKWAMRQATPTLTIREDAFVFTHMKPGKSTWDGGSGGASDIGKVTIRYNWDFMTPLIRPFFPEGRITLVVESAMLNEKFE